MKTMTKTTILILALTTMVEACKKKETTATEEPTPVNPKITSDIVVPTFIRATSSTTGYDLDLVVTCEGYELDKRRLTTKTQTMPPTSSCEVEGYNLDLKFKSGKKNKVEIKKSYIQQLRGEATFDYDFTGNSHVITITSSGNTEIDAGVCAKDTLWIRLID